MTLKFHCRHPLKVLSDDNIVALHNDTLKVLEEVGVKFEDSQALDLLGQHGCTVDRKTMVARLPASLVATCLGQSPPEFVLRGGGSKRDIRFDAHTVQFGPCCGMQVLDPVSGLRRPGTYADAVTAARLTDALDIMAGSNVGLGFIADRPRETNLVWQYAAALGHSRKICSLGSMDDSVKWGIRMARAVGRDVIVPVSSASPLGWDGEQIESVRAATRAGLPVAVQSMASPGTTAPVTLAGAAVVMNAEIVAMTVLTQLLRPGTGVMYSCFTIPMDMRTATLASGSMELSVLMVISAQLAKFYRLGSMVWAPMTDANQFDQQAGYEKGMQWLLAAQAGINLIWGAGMVENHGIWSNAQLIVDAEMCGMVGRYLEGVGVTPATRAVDEIKAVGHFPNNYLARDHTFDWFRQEQYLPLVSSRLDYESWQAAGSRDLLARADDLALELLQKHDPIELPADVERELERLLAAASREKGL